MLFRTIKRMLSNVRSFDKLQQLNKHLTAAKQNYLVVYFQAKWNPQCYQSNKDIDKFAANYPGIQVIKINSDIAPKIAKHYSVKAQPEFVFCLFGDQLIRQIGVNYNGLVEKVNKMDQIAKNVDLSYFTDRWVEYGTSYKEYYRYYVKVSYQEEFSEI